MNDDHEISPPKELSPEELRSLLAKKGFLRECPACSARAWVYVGETRYGYPAVPLYKPEETEPLMFGGTPPRIDSIALICDVCGFIRLHQKERFGAFIAYIRNQV